MSSLKDCVDALCRALKKETARIEALELKPSFKSKLIDNFDGTYTHSDGAGVSSIINLKPSDDGCNALSLGEDHRLFSEDFGYRVARTWQEVINLIAAGEDVLICQRLELDQDTVLGSDRTIRFVKDGGIDFNGFTLRLDVQPSNPNNRQIFFNFVLDETYPNRWTGLGSSLTGTFGGDNVRHAAWWGAVANDSATTASLAEREQNNMAIAGAALSNVGMGTDPIAPTTVRLGRGWFAIHRTVRLDGLRATLAGNGDRSLGTRLVPHSDGNVVPFDTDHFIITNKFPSGTTPVVQIGWEFQPGVGTNPDAGFRAGVESINLLLPLVDQARPISGIMWESGLQERGCIRQVSIANYSGYAIGCPEYQTSAHNQSDGTNVFPQVNSILIEQFNISGPLASAPNAIGIGIFGLNYTIRSGTISHHNGSGTGNRLQPPMYLGTRQSAIVNEVHLEHAPDPSAAYNGACLVVEDFVAGNANIGAMDINGVMGFFLGTVPLTTPTRTIWVDPANVAFHMSSIRSSRIPDANHAAIEDAARAVVATGNVQAGFTSAYTALYARQFNADEAAYRVVTTDAGLL